MQTLKLTLSAGMPQPVHVAGTVLVIQSADQGSTLSVDFSQGGAVNATVLNLGAGAKIAPKGGFSGVTVTSPVDANVSLIITSGDIDIQLTAIGSIITNTNANPVPVAIVSEPGAPFQVQAVPAGVAATDVAPVAIPNAGTQLVAASAGRKSLRVRNVGPGQLAITAAAATSFANAAIILAVGDVWIETDAPQAKWYGVSDTNATAAVQVVA